MWNLIGGMNGHRQIFHFSPLLNESKKVIHVDVIYFKYIVNKGAMRYLRFNRVCFLVHINVILTSGVVCGTEQVARPSNFVVTQV